ARATASSFLHTAPAPWTTPALSPLANSEATTIWPRSLFQTLLWILFMYCGLLSGRVACVVCRPSGETARCARRRFPCPLPAPAKHKPCHSSQFSFGRLGFPLACQHRPHLARALTWNVSRCREPG